MATLCASESSSLKSFYLGIQWGIGHSTGLLLVGTIFILLSSADESDTIDIPQSVTHALESLVGIFMIGLGGFGIWRAVQKRNLTKDDELDALTTTTTTTIEIVSNNTAGASSSLSMADVGDITAPIGHHHKEEHDHHHPILSRCSTTCLALSAGLVHGLAGPGGVLGVIPAVQIRNPFLGSLYLITFCVTSTMTMGAFAVTYGKFVKRQGWEFRIEVTSACFSIIVGITWLILLAMGKLEDIFG